MAVYFRGERYNYKALCSVGDVNFSISIKMYLIRSPERSTSKFRQVGDKGRGKGHSQFNLEGRMGGGRYVSLLIFKFLLYSLFQCHLSSLPPLPPAITSLLSTSESPFSFLINPSTP